MSDEESNNQHPSTVFVHVEDSAEKIGRLLQQYENEEITSDEMEEQLNNAIPHLPDVGCELGEGSLTVNMKPVPEDAEAAVYFYRDDDGTLRMTSRLFRYGDNEVVKDDDIANLPEIAALEIVRLVGLEHKSVLEQVLMSMAMRHMGEAFGVENEEGEDPLSSIEDDDTRERVRKMMKH